MLAVPVPALDEFVRQRTGHYDADYLAADPDFGQAHITVLGPWVRQPSPADLAAVAWIAAQTQPFHYRLEHLGVFPNGIVHLLPEPAEEFQALTRAAMEQFPDYPPYAGAFPAPVPHLTLDAVGPGVDRDVVREMLGERIPVTCRAEVVQLQWWQAGHCHVQQSWQLGRA